MYLLGTILFLLLIAGLGLLVILLLREVQLNERQSNFISAVTHELKTPVASLRLYLDTLQLRNVSDDRRDDFYRTMSQDLDRLTATINNVLNAAMYSDRAPIEREPLDFATLVSRAIELTRSRHQLAVEAIRYAGPESLTVRGDAGALETVVVNLLDNAVKYSRDDVSVDVSLDLDERGATRLQIHDDGIGMSRGHLRFLFNRFYRIGAEVRRRRTGTGLGLFIVHTVVKKHGGKVVGESAGPDQGLDVHPHPAAEAGVWRRERVAASGPRRRGRAAPGRGDPLQPRRGGLRRGGGRRRSRGASPSRRRTAQRHSTS